MSSGKPTHYAALLFPHYELQDPLGPIEVLTNLSKDTSPMRLSILTHDPDLKPINNNYPDSKNTFSTPIVPTHTLANAPADIDVLIVPGGMGSRFETDTSPYVEFIRQGFPGLKFIFSVCTGAELLAKAGVLDEKRCTTNKNDFERISGLASTAKWEKRARWSHDGKVWTTSGPLAGIDGMLAFVGHLYGEKKADEIATRIEHRRISDPKDDPFAIT